MFKLQIFYIIPLTKIITFSIIHLYMTYRKIYDLLMNIEHIEEKIFKLMQEQGIKDKFKIKSIIKKDNNGFLYLLATNEYIQDLNVDYAASYLSCLMDLSTLCLEAKEFYFPFICMIPLQKGYYIFNFLQ